MHDIIEASQLPLQCIDIQSRRILGNYSTDSCNDFFHRKIVILPHSSMFKDGKEEFQSLYPHNVIFKRSEIG